MQMEEHGSNGGSRGGRASQQLQERQGKEPWQARGAGPTLEPVLVAGSWLGSDQLDEPKMEAFPRWHETRLPGAGGRVDESASVGALQWSLQTLAGPSGSARAAYRACWACKTEFSEPECCWDLVILVI